MVYVPFLWSKICAETILLSGDSSCISTSLGRPRRFFVSIQRLGRYDCECAPEGTEPPRTVQAWAGSGSSGCSLLSCGEGCFRIEWDLGDSCSVVVGDAMELLGSFGDIGTGSLGELLGSCIDRGGFGEDLLGSGLASCCFPDFGLFGTAYTCSGSFAAVDFETEPVRCRGLSSRFSCLVSCCCCCCCAVLLLFFLSL